MASKVQNPANEEETSNSTPKARPVARRTPSFSSSSSSSSSSFNEEYPTFSPTTPLKFKGIPFSWEKIPGIPKHQFRSSTKKEYSEHLLPLPPAGNSNSAAKKSKRFQMDPFFAALVECSKDDNGHSNSKSITRSISDRFGFINLYTSCKSTCDVSESTVYLGPRPGPHYLLNRRSVKLSGSFTLDE